MWRNRNGHTIVQKTCLWHVWINDLAKEKWIGLANSKGVRNETNIPKPDTKDIHDTLPKPNPSVLKECHLVG